MTFPCSPAARNWPRRSASSGRGGHLRRAILESDYVLRSALGILDDVLTGRMRLEQAVDVSLSDPSMAGGLLRRIEANRRTLEHLLEPEPARLSGGP